MGVESRILFNLGETLMYLFLRHWMEIVSTFSWEKGRSWDLLWMNSWPQWRAPCCVEALSIECLTIHLATFSVGFSSVDTILVRIAKYKVFHYRSLSVCVKRGAVCFVYELQFWVVFPVGTNCKYLVICSFPHGKQFPLFLASHVT